MVETGLLLYVVGMLVFLTIYAEKTDTCIEVSEVWEALILVPMIPIFWMIKKARKFKKSLDKQ